jgi:cell division protein FtsB
MIRINLLPTEGAGRKARMGGAPASAPPSSPGFMAATLLLVLLLGVAAWYGYSSYTRVGDAKRALASVTAKRDKTKKELQEKEREFEKFAAESEEVEEKYAVVQGLSPHNRIFWSEKLNMIARARLDLAVYIMKLTLTEKINEIETPESIKRREEWKNRKNRKPEEKEPKPIKVPIINQTLTIEAIAYGQNSPERLSQVTGFSNMLTTMTWKRDNGEVVRFMDGMKPEFRQLPQKIEKVGGVEVLRFGFACEAEPQRDRTTTTPATAKLPPVRAQGPGAPGGKK